MLLNRDSNGHYAPQPSSRARIGQVLIDSIILETGVSRFRDRPPSTGVVTGVDEPLLRGEEKLDTTSLNFGVMFNNRGRFRPKLELATQWGDETTRRIATGINSGWAYQAALSPGDSIASAGGAESRLETDFRVLHAGHTLSRQFKDTDDSDAALDYYFSFGRSTRDYDGSIHLLSFPGVSSHDNLEISTYDINAGLGVRGRHTFRNDWTLSGSVRLDALYYRGEYDGDHHYLCDVCAPADRYFTQAASDSDDGLTWAGEAMGRSAIG